MHGISSKPGEEFKGPANDRHSDREGKEEAAGYPTKQKAAETEKAKANGAKPSPRSFAAE